MCKIMLEFSSREANTRMDEWLWCSNICRAVIGSTVSTYKAMPEKMGVNYNKADTGSM